VLGVFGVVGVFGGGCLSIYLLIQHPETQ